MARGGRDYFDKARTWAVAVMILAGAGAIAGAMLDWVTIAESPELAPDVDFGSDVALEPPEPTEPYSGVEARDGWPVLAGGIALIWCALLLAVRKRSLYGWLGFIACVVIGAVGIADYKGVGDLSSAISERMDVVGDPQPAFGITLVAASALVGLIASVAGVAASPNREP